MNHNLYQICPHGQKDYHTATYTNLHTLHVCTTMHSQYHGSLMAPPQRRLHGHNLLWNAYLIIMHHMQCIVFADSAD